MKHASGRFGFEIVRGAQPPHRMVARFSCNRCDAALEVKQSDPLNPEKVAKWAERHGWRIDAYHASVTRCPECIAKRGAPGDKPEKERVTMDVGKATAAQTVREATPQERQRIRAILDRQFDDGAGCYLDGYSDQKIGEELKLPWAMVTKIREAAYGPIRVDPEIAAMRAEIANVQRAAEALTGRVTELKARLEALEKRKAA